MRLSTHIFSKFSTVSVVVIYGNKVQKYNVKHEMKPTKIFLKDNGL